MDVKTLVYGFEIYKGFRVKSSIEETFSKVLGKQFYLERREGK